jgi:polyferredoxin
MFYSFLADLVVALHVSYVSFVVAGQLLILLGLPLRWDWVRNPWLRITHLLAIVIVGLEAVCGWDCPLTVWEGSLRHLSGQDIGAGSFMGRLLHNLIFYDFETWVFDVMHIAFAVLVIATFLVAPPRFGQRGHEPVVDPSAPYNTGVPTE